MTAAPADSPSRANALIVPEIVTPGDALSCDMTYVYYGDAPAPTGVLMIDVHPFGSVDADALTVNGQRVDVTPTGPRVVAALPPMQPGDALEVAWSLRVPLGIANGDAATVDVSLTAGPGKTTMSSTLRVRSSASISKERSLVSPATGAPALIGDEYVLNVSLFNEGTASARGLTIEVEKAKDVTVGALPLLSEIPAGDTHVCSLTVTPNGSKPQLTLRAKYTDGSTILAPFEFNAKKGPALCGRIEVDGELPAPTNGSVLPIRVTVENKGDAAANDVRVLLDLPTCVRLQSGSLKDRSIALPTIDAGSIIDRTVVLVIDDTSQPLVVGGHPLTSTRAYPDLESLRLAAQRVVSCVVSDFTAAQAPVAGEPFDTSLLLTFDGNEPADEVVVRVQFSDPLSFHGGLAVNGAPLNLTLADALTFKGVEPGTDVHLTWKTLASRGTMRGTTAVMTATIDLDGLRVEGSTPRIRVKPSVKKARAVGELPFTVEGAMPQDAAAEPIPKATPAVAPKPTPQAHAEAPTQPPVSTVQTSEQPTAPADDQISLAHPDPQAVRALRQRLALAASAKSQLSIVIAGLAALGDAGTHPASEDYQKAVFALRRAVTESASRQLKPAITNKLKADLAAFVALVPGEEVSLLDGLAAIADTIAGSANPEAHYWDHVRAYGRDLSDMLRAAATSEPNLEETPNAEHPALAGVKEAHAQMTLQVPTA